MTLTCAHGLLRFGKPLRERNHQSRATAFKVQYKANTPFALRFYFSVYISHRFNKRHFISSILYHPCFIHALHPTTSKKPRPICAVSLSHHPHTCTSKNRTSYPQVSLCIHETAIYDLRFPSATCDKHGGPSRAKIVLSKLSIHSSETGGHVLHQSRHRPLQRRAATL